MSDLPPAWPSGWYAIAFASEIDPGTLRTGRWFGRDLVIWRTASGRWSVMDAHCPHLGAHLGHGGTICGEQLRCPFHGLRFDADGLCVQGIEGAGDGGPGRPAKARAHTWPIAERCGVIAVWYHADGAPPAWEIPEIAPGGYGPLHTHTWPSFRGHPQETSENSVDIAHFSAVHGYTEVTERAPLRTDGPHLYAFYGMTRENPFLPVAAPVRVSFDVSVHGLGFSLVDTVIDGSGLRTRHLVLATPTDSDHIELRIAVAVDMPRPASVSLPLALLPRALAARIVGRLALRAYRDDVSQDFRIWQNKRYLEAPALAEGDGPVGPYRRWVRQFYQNWIPPKTPGQATTSPDPS